MTKQTGFTIPPAAAKKVEQDEAAMKAKEVKEQYSTTDTGKAVAPVTPEQHAVEQNAMGYAEIPTNTGVMNKETLSKRNKKAEKAEKKDAKIPVIATQKGWYDNRRIKPGQKFTIHAEEDFSELWMEKI